MYETYETYSTLTLLNMAEDFRNTVAALNGSTGVDYSRISVLEPGSKALVSAGRDGVRFNFASAAVARMIMGEIEDMQTAADEARLRLKNLPHPGMYEHMLLDMERESSKCLDMHFGTPSANLGRALNLGRP